MFDIIQTRRDVNHYTRRARHAWLGITRLARFITRQVSFLDSISRQADTEQGLCLRVSFPSSPLWIFLQSLPSRISTDFSISDPLSSRNWRLTNGCISQSRSGTISHSHHPPRVCSRISSGGPSEAERASTVKICFGAGLLLALVISRLPFFSGVGIVKP